VADNGARFNSVVTNVAGGATSNPAILTVSAGLSIAWNPGGNITLSWSGNAASYDVFSTNDYSTGFSKNPTAVVTSTTWTDSSASMYSRRFYRVAPHGSTVYSRVVGKFDLTLENGMNLVSLPLIPDDNSIKSVMHQNASYYPVLGISELKADGLNYMVATFNPAAPPNYWNSGSDPFTTLNVDKGYWFRTSTSAIFTLVGAVPVAPRTVTLSEGMHEVGWISLSSRKFLDAITQSPTNYHVTEVFERLTSGVYRIATYLDDYPPAYWWSSDSTFQNLTPGEGYKFKVQGSYSWTYLPVAVAGDVNGDRIIDLKDLLYFRKYLAGLLGYETIPGNGEMNGDGIVDLKDLLYLRKHLAGIAGY
jgi:hypothetical protein